MAGWLRGTVVNVRSGDTLTIAGAVKSGIPPQKRITLSSLKAPTLGRGDGSSADEPFAWASREALRKLTIGQSVIFKVDYVVDSISREFGTVFLENGNKDNVALVHVSRGWAKVKGGQQQSPYFDALKKAEEAAQLANLGLWTKDPTALASAVRDAAGGEDSFNATAFLQSVGKGKPVSAIVEAVINGSMLRVTLLPSLVSATIQLCGAQAPSTGKRAAADAPAPAPSANGAPPTAAAIAAMPAAQAGAGNAEPFSVESKYLTESRTLNRDVTLVVEGVDKYNNLFASLLLPPASADGPSESMAELLVKDGLAKVMEFSVNMISNGSQRLRDLERAAKQRKVGIWTNYVPVASNQGKLSGTFIGKVVEVVSGDCVVVKDSRTERRVQLSSLRAPRMSTRDRPSDPYATEAKEFLRKKLVGRDVEVKMEYTRKIPGTAGEAAGGAGDRELSFGNVELVPEKGEEKQNVGEMIVARGFATVIRHRSDEERSGVYEKLLECEELAKSAKRGVHSGKEPPPNRVNDVSQPGNATKAKQYLPFFTRSGTVPAVVDYVLSGHRLKLMIPKEGVCIVFAPSGIKTPSRAQPAGNGRAATVAEPYADEAILFTREHCMQRDCEVTIESMDRGGTFLGHINILGAAPQSKPFNLSLALIKAGLARIQPGMEPSRLVDGTLLAEAQRQAKESRLKIWEKWTPEQEAEENGPDEASNELGTSANGSQEVLEVVVTEVTSSDEFYLQKVDEPRMTWITEQLRLAAESDGPVIPPELRVGQLCLGQYSLDNQWYRAYVERANAKDSTYDVFFIDYGNKEKLPAKRVRVMDAALAAVPAQAIQANLAYIKVPSGASEYTVPARNLLAQLLSSGQPLLARVSSRDRPGAKDRHPKFTHGKLSVTLLEPESGANVAADLLSAGLAQLPSLRKIKDPSAREAIEKLQEFEEEARSARRGLFMYGDPGDSDDEATPPAKPPGAWGKK